jgi:hypothetical protein
MATSVFPEIHYGHLKPLEEDDGSEADEILLRQLAEEEKRCVDSLLSVWIRIGEVLSARKERVSARHVASVAQDALQLQ